MQRTLIALSAFFALSAAAAEEIGSVDTEFKPINRHEQVFREGASLVWKHVRVVRIVDPKRNTLVYLTYSDRLIDGFPDNAITAVAVADQKIPVR